MELLAAENQNIDGYETEDVLGRGFRSIVYKGREEAGSGQAVVVKVFKLPAGSSVTDVFYDSSGLHHPNIIPIKKIGLLPEGSAYSVRSFVDGSTLEDMLEKRGVIDSREAMHYLAQLASAVDYIHGQGAVHGNLKPSNVVVDARFRAMMFDLGVRNPAVLKSENEPLPVALAHYCAPEVLRGESFVPSSDVFSFGVLAFELLTGSRPFPGRDYSAVVSNILSSAPLSLNDVGSTLPKPVEECFNQALSKESGKRYPSAGEFVRALGRVMGIYLDEFGLVGGFSSLQATSNDVDRRVRAKTIVMPAHSAELLGTTKIQLSDLIPPSGGEVASDAPSSHDPAPKVPSSPSFGAPVEPSASAVTPAPQLSNSSQLRVVVFALLLGVVGAVGFKFFSSEGVTVSELHAERKELVSDEPSSSPEPRVDVAAVTTSSSDSSRVLVEALGSNSVSTIRGALEEAVKQGDLSVLPEMVKLADRPEYIVKVDLLKALAQPPFFDRDESFSVITKLITDNEYLVRGFAAKNLIASKRPDAAELLNQRLAEEKNAIVLKVLSQK
jgi:serine/threonine-protein kinase